jgi:hypothetical protein
MTISSVGSVVRARLDPSAGSLLRVRFQAGGERARALASMPTVKCSTPAPQSAQSCGKKKHLCAAREPNHPSL